MTAFVIFLALCATAYIGATIIIYRAGAVDQTKANAALAAFVAKLRGKA